MNEIKSNTEVTNNFNDFGFENPTDFKGQILAKIYGFYIGYAVWNETLKSCRWNQFGVDLDDDFAYGSNLKLINKNEIKT